jgi:hypothetical protein
MGGPAGIVALISEARRGHGARLARSRVTTGVSGIASAAAGE